MWDEVQRIDVPVEPLALPDPEPLPLVPPPADWLPPAEDLSQSATSWPADLGLPAVNGQDVDQQPDDTTGWPPADDAPPSPALDESDVHWAAAALGLSVPPADNDAATSLLEADSPTPDAGAFVDQATATSTEPSRTGPDQEHRSDPPDSADTLFAPTDTGQAAPAGLEVSRVADDSIGPDLSMADSGEGAFEPGHESPTPSPEPETGAPAPPTAEVDTLVAWLLDDVAPPMAAAEAPDTAGPECRNHEALPPDIDAPHPEVDDRPAADESQSSPPVDDGPTARPDDAAPGPATDPAQQVDALLAMLLDDAPVALPDPPDPSAATPDPARDATSPAGEPNPLDSEAQVQPVAHAHPLRECAPDEFDAALDHLEAAGALVKDLLHHDMQPEALERLQAKDPMLTARPGRTPKGMAKNPRPGYQSAHLVPQSVMNTMGSYDPGQAVTRMLPTGKGHAHTLFDQHWLRSCQSLRDQGHETMTVTTLIDIISRAATESGAFSADEGKTVAAMAQLELLFDHALPPDARLPIPGRGTTASKR